MGSTGHFTSEDARRRHADAYAEAMTLWPAHTTRTVETSYGPTGVQVAEGGGKTPLVLLHGLSMTSAMWWSTVGGWTPERTVYAIDAISDPGASRQREPVPGAPGLADWLDQTLDGLGLDDIHLCGVSYGGQVAVNQAVRDPSRLRSIVAVDPPVVFARVPVRFWLTAAGSLLGSTPKARWSWFLDSRSPRAIWELLDATRGFRPGGMAMVGKLSDDDLASLAVPALVVLPADSPVNFPDRVRERLARVAPAVDVVTLPTRHMVPMDDPDGFVAVTSTFFAAHD